MIAIRARANGQTNQNDFLLTPSVFLSFFSLIESFQHNRNSLDWLPSLQEQPINTSKIRISFAFFLNNIDTCFDYANRLEKQNLTGTPGIRAIFIDCLLSTYVYIQFILVCFLLLLFFLLAFHLIRTLFVFLHPLRGMSHAYSHINTHTHM